MGGQGAGGDVQHGWGQFARDFVQVGNHQQQPLGGGEGGGECPGLECAMHGPGRACFGLHFDDGGDVPPQVRPSFGRPLVGPLAHRRGGGDGVDGDDFVDFMSHHGGGLVGIYGYHGKFLGLRNGECGLRNKKAELLTS